jgi:hypothetical protein
MTQWHVLVALPTSAWHEPVAPPQQSESLPHLLPGFSQHLPPLHDPLQHWASAEHVPPALVQHWPVVVPAGMLQVSPAQQCLSMLHMAPAPGQLEVVVPELLVPVVPRPPLPTPPSSGGNMGPPGPQPIALLNPRGTTMARMPHAAARGKRAPLVPVVFSRSNTL